MKNSRKKEDGLNTKEFHESPQFVSCSHRKGSSHPHAAPEGAIYRNVGILYEILILQIPPHTQVPFILNSIPCLAPRSWKRLWLCQWLLIRSPSDNILLLFWLTLLVLGLKAINLVADDLQTH